MKSLLHQFKIAACMSIMISSSLSLKAATLFENFDNPSIASTNNTAKDITYPSGVWNVCAITKPNTPTENDRINGLYSMRMRGLSGSNFMFMKFDKAGAGVLSFNYGSYSNHSGGEFTIEKSTDQGATWTAVGSPVVVPKWSGTFLTYSLPVNYNGNIRFKIVMTLRTPNNANEQVNIDDFMITDYGTEQVTMPVSSVATGIYETSQTVTLTSATAGATIYYTTDGTAPTTASNVYSAPINVSATTKIRTIAVASGKVDSREEVVLISFPEQVNNLAALYTKMAASGTNLTYFKYTGEAIVTTSYTATYKTTFIQDNTAGILISDTYKNTVTAINTGDKITNIIAQVNRINDSPQLYPYNDFMVLSTGNIVVPPVITLADVPNRTYQLVQINNLIFDEANGTKTFGPNTPYVIHDASTATTTTAFRTPSGMPNPDYNGTVIPAQRNVICLVARNSSAVTTHTIFARTAADLNVQLSGIHDISAKKPFGGQGHIFIETSVPTPVKVYTPTGILVKDFNALPGMNNFAMPTGIYAVCTGGEVTKVIVH